MFTPLVTCPCRTVATRAGAKSGVAPDIYPALKALGI
jgi:hypothetical protein